MDDWESSAMIDAPFEKIWLEPQQKELLVGFVDAARNVPIEHRQKFLCVIPVGAAYVHHPGLPGANVRVYEGDLETLHEAGLIRLSKTSASSWVFDVTPFGFRYYSWLKTRAGQPIQHIETEVRAHLEADLFRQKYPMAYQKWSRAEGLLWTSDSMQQFTTVGHSCREAMQEFATALVERYKPPDVDPDKTHDKNRVDAVLRLLGEKVGDKEQVLLTALMAYWTAVCGLAQRQEHDSRKEGHPLVWEDGRRLVFQLMVVMYEIDRLVSRSPA
jgi:hypothetical protein